MTNTDKEIPCVACGSQGNIVRENVSPELRKLKCNACNFMYTEADSIRAVEAGAIPDGKPALADPPAAPSRNDAVRRDVQPPAPTSVPDQPVHSDVPRVGLPRTLAYVVVAKDRSDFEFTTNKGLKKIIFQWETAGKKYEVFELTPKAVTAKVDIK